VVVIDRRLDSAELRELMLFADAVRDAPVFGDWVSVDEILGLLAMPDSDTVVVGSSDGAMMMFPRRAARSGRLQRTNGAVCITVPGWTGAPVEVVSLLLTRFAAQVNR
jgi:hypothetical protein